MRVAVISDIHGNVEALQAVLQDIQAGGIQETACLGDVVGYGADPEACWDLVRTSCQVVVRGNHDQALEDLTLRQRFRSAAQQALDWTAARLTPGLRKELAALPLTIGWQGFTLAHASPFQPERFGYVMDSGAALEAFRAFTGSLCLIGHTHVPALWQETTPGELCVLPVTEAAERPGAQRRILNAGSVGQPRDGHAEARWVEIDTVSRECWFHAVPYNVTDAQRKILDAGLPATLAERLSLGL